MFFLDIVCHSKDTYTASYCCSGHFEEGVRELEKIRLEIGLATYRKSDQIACHIRDYAALEDIILLELEIGLEISWEIRLELEIKLQMRLVWSSDERFI